MFPFDVVLFDVGGVLLTNGWDHRERAVVAKQFSLDLADLEARHAIHYGDWERDAINAEAYLASTVFYEPRNFTQRQFFDAICAQSMVLPNGALGILAEVAAQGKCLVGALNNEAGETNEYRFREFGLRKPEPAIYVRALDILGRPAKRILFIDDRPENVAAAQEEGIKTIVFTGADKLKPELERLGVL